MKIYTFTGHRLIANEQIIEDQLKMKILEVISKDELDECFFIVGGSPGFDSIVLRYLLEIVPTQNIEIAVPFIGFEQYASSNVDVIKSTTNLNINSNTHLVEVGGEQGTFGEKCFRRNCYMVKKATHGIFTNWGGSCGGTGNTLKIARANGLPIYHIWSLNE